MSRRRRRSSAAAKAEHAEYLRSLDWKLTRGYRVALAGGRCEACGSRRRLQAHHITYERAGSELLEDLEVLCTGCHAAEHNIKPRERSLMAETIEVQDRAASTAPASIAIRTLVVNGEAMTLAVYRQLPERAFVAEDGRISGDPWGTVNVCPSRDCPAGHRRHRHVVWSADGELYRDVCVRPGRFEPWSESASDWATLALAEADWVKWTRATYGEAHTSVAFVEGLPAVRCELSSALTEVQRTLERLEGNPVRCGCRKQTADGGAAEHDSYCDVARYGKAWDTLGEAIIEVRERHQIATLAELTEAVRGELRDQHARHGRWVESFKTIDRLPQLFLGVENGTSPARGAGVAQKASNNGRDAASKEQDR